MMKPTLKPLIASLIILFVLVSFKNERKKITIYSIGDSTMCDFAPSYLSQFGGDNYPIRGWMQMMPGFFNDQVLIHNAARSGRSSKSFRTEGHWKPVIDQVKAGDYVFIMFGGNDQKPDTARHTDPQTTYRQNLLNYVNETKAKGAYPILFTSLVRRSFGKDGKLRDTYGDYVTAVRNLAKEINVPLIDMYQKSWDLVEGYGPEESKKLFLYIEPGKFTKLPEGKKDDSHLCVFGATEMARLAAQGLKEIKSPLAGYLK
ncbi:rhamnogalacturonan acetylesterase [Pedobacter heparinus]|uniref:Lipolytic protein G-D-S-L family n=1 Tax=Pedobacter heparinus (strain ATCC 13125 / DSM 2366 / CIP 104194 / JCM 7457 / NBRC 12017 / NCIMB 9290 / NRRL B-14731 / HIM 762-3) TaxID=485917 RepID=C6Y1L5_PEDHD|nr:GDSL-type esterase/lipase family protein [Pedobacter heparinus]ACU02991.1 lipolytic protein G-D-S-L family [Pedobacter heparinus DSM 2366]